MHIFDIFLSPHIQLHLRDVNSKGSIDFFEQNSWINTKIKTNYPDANFAPILGARPGTQRLIQVLGRKIKGRGLLNKIFYGSTRGIKTVRSQI